ncbi:MAG TPA: SigE family RNA polymerase sigma factor [Actinomycetota bacterium]|nr:SigE family RNA polymerase sigma factor [Actinomycetota bacterium]
MTRRTHAGLYELYELHADRAKRLAYLLTGDPDLAEDLLQDAFVKVAGAFRGIRKPEAFGGYLRTTIVNLARSYFRRSKSERAYLEKERARPARANEQPDLAVRTDLFQALQKLSVRQRTAVVLRYYEDLSERQAADVLGLSVPALKSLVNRAMENLRAEVGSEGRT